MGRVKYASILALALFVVWAVQAGGHAILVRSIPEADAELPQPPPQIDMWFSEPLEAGFNQIRLLTSTGQEAPVGAINLDPADPTHLTVTPEPLEPGIYTVAWQNLSQTDGHEWTGSFPFTVLNPDGSRPTGSAMAANDTGRSDLPTPAETFTRWLALLGGILFFGGPLFQLLVAPKDQAENNGLQARSRNLVLRAIWAAVLAVVLSSWLQIIIQAFRLGGMERLPGLLFETRTGVLVLARQALALTGLFVVLGLPQPPPLRGREWPTFILTATAGGVIIALLLFVTIPAERALVVTTVALAGLGMLLATLTSRQNASAAERRTWQGLLLVAGVLLFSFSIGSHAGAVLGSVWAVLGDFVHLLAAGAWVGGMVLLPLLGWRVYRGDASADRAQWLLLIRRFSFLAGLAVFGLVVTGLFSSLVQVPSLASLVETPYGRVLLVKLGLVGLTLLAAFSNNRLVHRRSEALQQAGLRRFNRQVALEAIFSLGLMVSVAVLVQTTAPRSLTLSETAFQPALPFNQALKVDDLNVHLQITPNQVGRNDFWVHLYHDDNSPIGDVQLVRLFFNYQDAPLGRASADLQTSNQNIFTAAGAYLNQSGAWDISVYVRRRGLDDILADFSLDVPALARAESGMDPWQNPIPAMPAGLVIAGGLVALGVVPLIWGRFLRQSQPRGFLGVRLIGGGLILAGLITMTGSLLGLLA